MKSIWSKDDIPTLQDALNTLVQIHQQEYDESRVPIDAAISRYNSLNWLFRTINHEPLTGMFPQNEEESRCMRASGRLDDAIHLRKRVALALKHSVTEVVLSDYELAILKKCP